MSSQTLNKADWEHYFNHLSSVMSTFLAEVEVAGLDIGDQVEGEWVPLSGLAYDPKDDLITIDLDSSRVMHNVQNPVEVVVEEDDNGLKSLSIKDADGHLTILKLKTPMALPKK